MAAKNPITGDRIASRPATEQGRDRLAAIEANRGCKDLDRKTPCENCNCWKKK